MNNENQAVYNVFAFSGGKTNFVHGSSSGFWQNTGWKQIPELEWDYSRNLQQYEFSNLMIFLAIMPRNLNFVKSCRNKMLINLNVHENKRIIVPDPILCRMNLIFLLFKHKQIKIKNHFIFLMLYLYNLHVSYKFLFSIINLQSYNLLLSRDSDNGL